MLANIFLKCSVYSASFDPHSYPHKPRYHLPEEDKQAVEPVDGDYVLAPFESIDYTDGYFSRIELHWEIAALYQRSLDESRTYVRDVNIADVPYSRQLAEAFEIMACEPF